MTKSDTRGHGGANFAVSLTLFTVFALALTLVLLTGAAAFREISEESEARFNERTPLLFMANRLYAADAVQIVEIGESGTPALLIREEFADVYIYLYDGYLREHLTFDAGIPPRRLDLGFELVRVDSIAFVAESPTLLRVTVNGRDLFARVGVISGEE
jgi:hypothetical protein